MKFKIEVERIDGGGRHWEEYDEDTDDAQKWAENIVIYFNDTCHPGETHRRLLNVEVLDNSTHVPKEHHWEKQNLSTLNSSYGMFDKVKCRRCGVIARRYEFTRIVRQTPFRAKKFARCDTAMEALNTVLDKEGSK